MKNTIKIITIIVITITKVMKNSLKIKEKNLIKILIRIFMIHPLENLLLWLIVSKLVGIKSMGKKVDSLIMVGKEILAIFDKKHLNKTDTSRIRVDSGRVILERGSRKMASFIAKGFSHQKGPSIWSLF